jgi:uncharacterized membrane protein
MKILLLSFLVALVVLAILDTVWLGIASREFYKTRLGDLLLDRPIWSVAVLFYAVHAAGIAVFPVQLALGVGTWWSALLYGGLFGFCVYAAYDLTNLATLRGWPAAVSVVDLAWGAAVTAVATVVAFMVVKPD